MNKLIQTIRCDAQLTPAALRLIEAVEAREASAPKASRVLALKEAARRIEAKLGKAQKR